MKKQTTTAPAVTDIVAWATGDATPQPPPGRPVMIGVSSHTFAQTKAQIAAATAPDDRSLIQRIRDSYALLRDIPDFP
jgi:hypothetical protein